MRKLDYPRNDDIAEAILAVLSKNPLISPADFVEEVIKELKERGFYTNLVNAKRVWRIYESMVRKGTIYDVLDVVKRK